ncbi:MAG: helix-turn-helix transcriptional regulator [Oscillospiraceae bacterium]|nr:helix-turn-helix transcriptional regulator [Oscillospiraceae bacterium]
MNDVGKNIRRYREQQGLTQDALAERLHVTRQAVSNWETGKNQPDLETLEALAGALRMEPAELIYGKTREYPRFQRKAVIWTLVLGLLVLLALLDALVILPLLMELRKKTFNVLPYAVNQLAVLPLGFVAAGMLVPAVLSLRRSVEPGKGGKLALRIASVLLLIPWLLTLPILLSFLLSFRMPGFALFILSDPTRVRQLLAGYVLPFCAGLCLYPAWVKLKKTGE